ncbi:antiviral reverse transcriptase Drt3b [Shewanella sp. Isolate8]|uniref:antiviral reverse transcriptase Drt3b n=1 Tax=Shewanella sp. Isolate8 TaxID=2908529 RepID=UPI001EFCCE8F|nr:antiviral reverse transcriptase Drt3b [Shewanella sp. Isolate8]MCG9746272.1 RNA-directed DNA polymerase [Shewanella sp. Isolate8]
MDSYLKDIFIGDMKNTYQPYNFRIKKGEDKHRVISVAHPASQFSICNLIHNNAELVTYLCSKSNFSIRKPTRVASYFYQNKGLTALNKECEEVKDNDVEQQKSISDESYSEDKYGTSYFSYDGYTLLYKFFSSLKFQAVEKKYTNFLRFDVAKCFSSIYTHSISWAIKGKSFSKINAGSYSFDDQFDKIIRNMNEGETNGIIVGPEFSRVFAEIILQKIDTEAENRLLKLGYRNRVDYEVKRYVDDFFVFTRSTETADDIYNTFIDVLSEYKLFVNESKDFRDTRPFITNLTIAKTEVADVLSEFFKSIKRDRSDISSIKDIVSTPSIQHIYKPYTRSNNLITRFKSIVKINNASYDAFSGLVMTIFRSRTTKLLEEVEKISDMEKYSPVYRNYIIFLLDFLSFIYVMSTRVRTSHIMSQIFVVIRGINIKLLKSDQLEVEKKLRDEVKLFVRLAIECDKPRIEFVNSLISLRSLFGEDVLDDSLILDFFNTSKQGCGVDSLDYFDLTSLMYLCCLDGNNIDIVTAAYSSLKKRISACDSPKNSSELIHLLVDLGTFPFIDEEQYKSALNVYLLKEYGAVPPNDKVNRMYNSIRKQRFFVDWRKNININKMLQRKEMQRGYDS